MKTINTLNIMTRAAVLLACATLAPAALAGGGDCGDALLQSGETCDDGNTQNGDGCSAACDVEYGFECTAPHQPLTNNTVEDPGFELGAPSNIWNEFSTNNATVLCSPEVCPNEPTARLGLWWGRFGAFEPDVSRIAQPVFISSEAAQLQFDFRTLACDSAADTFTVLIDGVPVLQTTGSRDDCTDDLWTRQVVDLNTAPGGPWNDNDDHELEFISQTAFVNNGPSLFAVDNVFVGDRAGAPTPSRCAVRTNRLLLEDFDPGVEGNLDSLGVQLFELGDNPLPWGTTDDGVCGTGEFPPGNFTGGAGEAACIDASAGGGGEIFSFLCLPEIDLSNVIGSQLSFLLNVQFGPDAPDDFFAVVLGDVPPDPDSLLSTYILAYGTNDSIGELGAPPGQQIDIDISVLDGEPSLWACFVFFSTASFYAQVDNTEFTFDECVDDTDQDKLEGCVDNCSDWPNPDQTDSDGDGYGNACDGDIARFGSVGRVEGGNGNDCQVNTLDLGTLRSAFFSDPTRENWNPDADLTGDLFVNSADLARMKQLFFQPVGPSGATNVCGPQAPAP